MRFNDHGHQPPPPPPPPAGPSLRDWTRFVYRLVMAALLVANLGLSQTAADASWQLLVRHCLNLDGSAPLPPGGTGPPLAPLPRP